ncbi:hypothetical protein PS3A_05740 [Pseudomonas sp. 3A(2025)]
MSNLIINGDFTDATLAPWISTSTQDPVFEPFDKSSRAYSLQLKPSTQIQQMNTATETRPFLLKWTFSARIDSRASLGASIVVLLTARAGFEYYFDTSVTHELTDQWQTFSYTGHQPFAEVNEGVNMQIICSRTFDGGGEISAPVQITGISLSTITHE